MQRRCGIKWPLQFCSGISRVSSSQQTLQDVASVSKSTESVKIPIGISPSGLAGRPQVRKLCSPCKQTLLHTGAPDCTTENATGTRQCNSLQCSLVYGSVPWLYCCTTHQLSCTSSGSTVSVMGALSASFSAQQQLSLSQKRWI